MIVAHPDDESMFCGGTVAKFSSWSWDVVCAAHSLGSPRGAEFRNACAILGGTPIMLDVEYHGKHGGRSLDHAELQTKLAAAVDLAVYDVVLTHNPRGEYGQRDHKVVHEVVRSAAAGTVWMFGFNELRCDLSVHMDERSHQAKMAALACYTSQTDRIVLVDVSGAEHFVAIWR